MAADPGNRIFLQEKTTMNTLKKWLSLITILLTLAAGVPGCVSVEDDDDDDIEEVGEALEEAGEEMQ